MLDSTVAQRFLKRRIEKDNAMTANNAHIASAEAAISREVSTFRVVISGVLVDV
jgi:hypothetical protein